MNGAVAQSIVSGCTFDDAVIQQEKMRETGTAAVTIRQPGFPPRLAEIFDPPVLLFARGRVELLETLMFAIVGTRRPTPYGVAVAEKFGAELAGAGLTIVSGMARGIDTAAHKGALSAGGSTVAVLGCGVDVVYPSENKRLAAEIVAKGLLISEFPMGSVAFPQNFPIRNRIVSGMSTGVLVVEGAQYSGSAITAKLALDQGRDVFAVPGNITSKASWGPNLLIKQGARLVQDPTDVISDLSPDARLRLLEHSRSGSASATSQPEQASLPISPQAEIGRKILEVLKVDVTTHIDQLLETVEDHSSSELVAALFELELAGQVKQLPGRNFVKVW